MLNEEQAPEQRAYKDRSFSLELMGGSLILQGGVLLLIVVAMLGFSFISFPGASGLMPADAGLMAASSRSGALGSLIYAVLSFWLGWGSLRARKWACRILATLGAVFTAYGALTLVLGVFTYMPMLRTFYTSVSDDLRNMPTGYYAFLFSLLGILVLLMFIGIPLSVWYYYRSPSVRATCDVRDATRDWTASCPSPLLALCIVWGWYAISYVNVAVSGYPSALGPVPLSGISAMLFGGLVAAMFVLLVVGTFRARPWAWIGGILMMIALGVNATFMDLDTFMPASVMDNPELSWMMESMNMETSAVLGVASMSVVVILYLLYARKYFFGATAKMEHS